MDFTKLVDLDYLFYRLPPAGFSWTFRLVLLAIFIGCIILAIYSHKKIKTSPGVVKLAWRKMQTWAWSVAIVGLLLVTFREVRAVYLGSRVWLLLWLLISLAWLIIILIYWKREIPKKKEYIKAQEEYNRWLPKRKI